METIYTTLTIGKVRPADFKSAQKALTEYRNAGNGSNRTNWVRMADVLASVLAVIRSGQSVEVTEMFHPTTWGQKPGLAPAYNLAHRALSADLIRPYWHKIQVHALMRVETVGSTVRGISNTTAVFTGDPTMRPIGPNGADYAGSVRLFYGPAES